METTWNKIKTWLQQNAPDIHDELNQGATPQDFCLLEELTGASLPEDFKFFYRIHNGQDSISDTLTEMGELLSIERISDEWRIWKSLLDKNSFENSQPQPDEGVQNTWWHPHWIPITYDGAGNHFCMDLAPAPKGTTGQIITMWHDSNERQIVANSFTEWINQFAHDLDAQKYEYSEEAGGIIRKENHA